MKYEEIKRIEEIEYWITKAEIIMRAYRSMDDIFNPLQDKKKSENLLKLLIITGLIEIFNERKRPYKTNYFILNQLKNDKSK